MSYVDYNVSLYRQGYRPYGETNPEAAAGGLSGLGRTPFAPERIHRTLGQNPPFTPEGGYRLHGLDGRMRIRRLGLGFMGDAGIPNGSIVTYQGTWTSVFNTGAGYKQQGDPQSIVNGVVAAMNADGQLTVIQAPQGLSSSFTGAVSAALGLQHPFSVTLVLEVTNGLGFSDVNSIISIVQHFVYQISSLFPQASAITSVVTPADPNAAAAASPSNVNYQAGGILNPGGYQLPATPTDTTGSAPAPTDLTTWLEQNAQWVALGAGLLIAVPLILRR
jgi:hypothetical protein